MIGILGGTFDPVHNGHLRVALDVVEKLGLQQLRFIPLDVAVHRAQPQAGSHHRLAMLQAAIASEPRFLADDRELQRQGASYTLDTLISLHRELDNEPICLLLGSDAFNNFLAWREPHQILQLAHLVVMQRPGYKLPADAPLRALVEQKRTDQSSDLQQSKAGKIFFIEVTQLAISASNIRERLREGKSARYLTPDPVLSVIEEKKLYQR